MRFTKALLVAGAFGLGAVTLTACGMATAASSTITGHSSIPAAHSIVTISTHLNSMVRTVWTPIPATCNARPAERVAPYDVPTSREGSSAISEASEVPVTGYELAVSLI